MRWRVRASVVLVFLLAVGVGLPPGMPLPGSFPLDGLWRLLSWPAAWAAQPVDPRTPEQPRGGVTDRDRVASAQDTRADGGSGRPRGSAPGELPADEPVSVPDREPLTTAAEVPFDPRAAVRDARRSSESMDVYENADGSFTQVLSTGRVNYQVDGQWVPIDTRLVERAGRGARGDEVRWETAANDVVLSVADPSRAGRSDAGAGESASAWRELASLTLPGGGVFAYGLAGAEPVRPVVKGSVSHFAGIQPDVDLEIEATATGLKETIVLHSAQAGSSWVFPLRLSGLSASIGRDGSVELADAEGVVVGRVPAGHMRDSLFDTRSGEFATSTAVRYELVEVDGGPALRVSVDEEWLRDPARVYPVYVDPSVDIGTDGDVFIDSYAGGPPRDGNNLPAGTAGECCGADGGVWKRRSFIRFTGFNPFDGYEITAASLSLFHTWSYDCLHHEPVTVWPVTSSWSVGGLSSLPPGDYPGPSLGLFPAGTLQISDNYPACTNSGGNRSIGAWRSVSLDTDVFNAWSFDTMPNYGLALTASESDPYAWKRFTSKNHASGAYAPYLTLTWRTNEAPAVAGQYPPSGHAAGTLTPTLTVVGSDVGPMRYSFTIVNADEALSPVASSGWLTTNQWTVPPDTLSWGKTYLWYALVDDYWDPPVASDYRVLSVRVPQPLITGGLSQNPDGPGFSAQVGNYTTTATDAQVETVGPALEITRSYNSRDPRADGAFGAGWSSLLDARVAPADGANTATPALVTMRYPSGQEVTFGRNADGTWDAGSGRFSILTEPGGGYELLDKNATRYTFQRGLGGGVYGLTKVTDAAGRELTLTYGDDGVETITSESGRELHLEWETPPGASEPRVTSVETDRADPTDSLSTSIWIYNYSGDRLASVCPPDTPSDCHVYEYASSEELYLHSTAALDAAPRTYLRLGQSSGGVVKSAATDSLHLSTATGVNTGTDSSRFPAATFNGTSSYMELTGEETAVQGFYQSVSLWFKTPNGAAGGVLLSIQSEPISQAAPAWFPVLYVGTDGKLHGKFYDSGGDATIMVSSAAVNNGQWHHAVLTSTAAGQRLYVDGQAVSSKTHPRSVPAGLDHVLVGGGQWWLYPATSGGWGYFNGSIAELAFYDRPLPESAIKTLFATGNAKSRPLTTVKRPTGGVATTVDYDQSTGRVSSLVDANGGTWTLAGPQPSGSDLTYASTVLAAGPSNYWRLQQSSGNNAVNAVNGIGGIDGTEAPGVTLNSVTLNVDGPFDGITQNPPKAAGFNGTSSHMDVGGPPVDTTAPYSVSLWAKIDDLDATQYLVVMPGDNGGSAFKLAYDKGANKWSATGAARKADGTVAWWAVRSAAGAATPGEWTHLAFTAEPATSGERTVTLYVDGVEAESASTPVPFNNMATSMRIGYEYSTLWFDGTLAEVATFGRALSAQEVAAQFNARYESTGAPVTTYTVTDPMGGQASTVHDLLAGGRLVRSTDKLGQATTYGYDTGGFLRTVTDPNGNTTVNGHDARGNVVSRSTCQDQSENVCSTTYYTYFPAGNNSRTLTPDARNDVRLTEQDGRSADATDPTYRTTFTYDAAGNNTSVTDPLGRVTTTTYSTGSEAAVGGGTIPPGLPLVMTSAGGSVHTIEYYATGDAAAATDPSGKREEYTYDGLGRIIEVREIFDPHPADQSTTPVTLVTTHTYYKNGLTKTTTAPPVLNEVTGATHQAKTTTSYDEDGQPTSTLVEDVSPTGGDAPRETEQGYNSHGQLEWVSDAMGRRTYYTYDLRGNQITQTPTTAGGTPIGPTILLEYDAENRLRYRKVKDYGGAGQHLVLESRNYDPAGRLQRVVDVMNWETTYTYTDNNLLRQVTRSEGGPSGDSFVLESRAYDAAGNITSTTTANGTLTTTYTPDQAGRVTSVTVDSAGVDRTTTYSYDRDDHVVSTQISDGTTSQRTDALYDTSGNLLAQTAYPEQGITPVGRWQLDDGSGTVAADSAGNSPATITGGVAWSTDHGGSATFDGTGTLATDGPVVDTTRPYTAAAWVTIDAGITDNRAAVAQIGSRRTGLYLGYHGGTGRWWTLFCRPNTDEGWCAEQRSTSSATANVWTHLAVVNDQEHIKLYVNGVLQGEADVEPGNVGAAGPVWVGAGLWDGSPVDHWSGSIDDVWLYQDALNATQIGAIYSGTAPDSQVIRTSTSYDQRGLPTATTDPNGVSTIVRHDAAGRPVITETVSVTSEVHGTAPAALPVISTVGYDTFGAVTETLDPNGRQVTTAYNANGQPESQTLPAYTPPDGGPAITDAESTVEYDVLGRVWKTTDPLGHVTERHYDTLSRVDWVKTPDGETTSYEYDDSGKVQAVVDPTGARVEATWDYLGRQVTTSQIVRQPSQTTHTTTYEYWPSGAVKKITPSTPGRNPTLYQANAVGETTSMTDPAGNTYSYIYDVAGRPVRSILPDGTSQKIVYDGAGRPVQSQTLAADGTTVLASSQVQYNRAGDAIATTDAAGHTTLLAYDPIGRLTTVTEPVSATESITTSYGYDASGARTRFTNGEGHDFWTTYNTWGLPEAFIEPATTAHPNLSDRAFTNVYDKAGRVSKQLLPGGVSITNTYDVMDRLEATAGAGAEATTTTRTFAYDDAGRPTELTADGGTNVLTWDDRGLLLSVTGPSGNSSYAYTGDGLLQTRIDAAGTTTYGYDAAARLSTIDNTTADVDVDLSYNTISQIEQVHYTDGTEHRYRTFGYDSQHRLEADVLALAPPSTTELGRIDYSYDANGNITTKDTVGFAGAAQNTYAYDWANRLTAWTEDNGTSTTLTSYTYDDAGNRTSIGERTFNYDERNRLVSDSLGNTYTYTARGTRATQVTPTQQTLTTLSDAFGQVLSQEVVGQQATYTYDGLGRLLQTGHAYTGLGNDLATDGTTDYVRDPIGGVIGTSTSSTNRLVWTDQHTDVVGQFTPSSTALTGSATYDPLGNVRASTGLTGTLGYQSEYTDQLTGRVNMHARWYNPDTGQFDNRDTIPQPSLPASINANGYAYANANPLSGTDPTGHVVRMDGGGGGSCANDSDECQLRKLEDRLRIEQAGYNKALAESKIDVVSFLKQMGLAFFLDMIGWTALQGCLRGSAWDCVDLAMSVIPITKIASMVKTVYRAVDRVMSGYKAWKRITSTAKALINSTRRAIDDIRAQIDALKQKLSHKPSTPNAPKPPGAPKPGNPSSPSTKPAPTKPPQAPKPPPAVKPSEPSKAVTPPKPADPPKPDAAPQAPPRPDNPPKQPPRQDGASCPVPWATGDVPHSFDPATPVLMADGTTKRIDEINLRDEVLATDPDSGDTYAREVTALHRNQDTELTDITVSPTPAEPTPTTGEGHGDRSTRGPTTTIKTTAHHPFWDATTGEWANAAQLEPGRSTLVGPHGETQHVIAVRNHTGNQEMRDLTVATTHTYYVLAGNTPVLVHNADGDDGPWLYRAVRYGHPAYQDALRGIAIPWGITGGHHDPARHAGGGMYSIFTSWTTDESFATEIIARDSPGGPGVVLRVRQADVLRQMVASPDLLGESEVLLADEVRGAQVKIGVDGTFEDC